MYHKELFCKRLIELRKSKNLSRAGLAEKFLVARQTVDRWENGTREPLIHTLWELADYYGVTVDFLIGRSDG